MIIVGGPTASGKSALAVDLALALGGEVVSADAMAIWRGFDIGTAKPTTDEARGVPHHMIDVADPCEPYTVAQYRADAGALIADIEARGKRAVVCGGTGLYLRALCMPLSFGGAPGDAEVRARWHAYAEEHGKKALHEALARRDPDAAHRLHVNDVRRTVRALEICEITGRPTARREEDAAPREDILYIAVVRPREALIARIEERVDGMMARGLLDEVRALRASGIPDGVQAMQGLGYKELAAHLRGESSLDEAVTAVKTGTRRYAKRQMTWLRREEGLVWIDPGITPVRDVVALCGAWLAAQPRPGHAIPTP